MKISLSKLLTLMLPLFVWGCAAASSATPQAELESPSAGRVYRMGVAGLIPAHYPNPAFTSVSLRSNDGSPKPALERWQERVSMPPANP